MIMAVAISLLALTAQTGELPEPNETIYEIELPNGEIRYGAVREKGRQLTIVFDEPWSPKEPWNTTRVKSYEPEPQVMRAQRIEEQASEAGYVLRETQSGPRWLPQKEVEYFDRAVAWAKRAAPPPPASEPVESAATAEAAPVPGFLNQFGPHIAIVLVGVALLAVVIRTMILSE